MEKTKMIKKEEAITQARSLMRTQERGILSTHSKAMEGFPFGSVTTFISSVQGEPIFYLNDLDQHTKNISNNPKICITIFSENDQSSKAKLSLLGEAYKIDMTQSKHIKQRFFSLHLDSAGNQKPLDFNFFIVKCERLRFIDGFEDNYWLDVDDWLLTTPQWLSFEEDLITQINHDHFDALSEIYQYFIGKRATQIELLAINPEGFFIRADANKPQYIHFEKLAFTSSDVRQEIGQLTRAARMRLVAV